MSERMLTRPGLLSSFYPERADERLGKLDWLMAQAGARIGQVTAGRLRSDRVFRMRVRRAGRALEQLTKEELTERRIEIAARLRRDGLTTRNSVEAFALVREVSGRTIGMRHFGVQIVGGRLMLDGKIAEMETGEGKTLTATLPAAVTALSGVPVHVITVNDFLAERDAQTMGPLFRALGLSVGTVTEDMSMEERRANYTCDVTYTTNKSIAFDYLKDRLILEQETRPIHMALDGLLRERPRQQAVLMRGLCYAIVDEADSVLIDEARTPLIITREGDNSDLEVTYSRAVELARKLQRARDFTLKEKEFRVELTDFGRAALRQGSSRWGGLWAAEGQREELAKQALSALYLYQRDKHYIVEDEAIQIVDEYTGRVMADRSWERGLHQMIEVKEGVEITGRRETLIRISYQRFFRRYMKLSGMTGTAREVSGELKAVYRLGTRRVPTHRRSRRRDQGLRAFVTAENKWRAVLRDTRRQHDKGRPVLIGTRSVAASEHLAALLADAGLPHRVLNARQTLEEAEIIARAGEKGRITVATNMAGRGTDIVPTDEVRALGGLHVIGTERHDAARIDRQLAGRCGRQGDPGTHVMMISLEDDLLRLALGRRLRFMRAQFAIFGGRVPGFIARRLADRAQRATERKHSAVRRSLLKADDSLEDLLAFSGRTE